MLEAAEPPNASGKHAAMALSPRPPPHCFALETFFWANFGILYLSQKLYQCG
jgi:hypothetical protein